MQIINAVGRRKTSIARVYLTPGTGEVVINNKPLEKYFPAELSNLVKQPLQCAEVVDQYNIKVNVKGGGFKGQAEATRLGAARALCKINPIFRPPLKKEGYLTRDPRMTERKKYGKKKARKSPQFNKR